MGWFSGFNPHKTKTQLRLCIGRIKLLRNKKVLAVKTYVALPRPPSLPPPPDAAPGPGL